MHKKHIENAPMPPMQMNVIIIIDRDRIASHIHTPHGFHTPLRIMSGHFCVFIRQPTAIERERERQQRRILC